MSPFLLVKIIVPFQNSKIALIAARFDVYASVLAEWYPGEAHETGTKQYPAA